MSLSIQKPKSDYGTSLDEKLSTEQKKELSSRIESYHNDRSIGKSWSEIKSSLLH